MEEKKPTLPCLVLLRPPPSFGQLPRAPSGVFFSVRCRRADVARRRTGIIPRGGHVKVAPLPSHPSALEYSSAGAMRKITWG